MAGNVVVIGFSGTGKSSVGRALGRLLGWPHVDTDDVIVRASGRAIPAIFEEEGEPAFRRLERQALETVLEAGGMVVSVGGGAPVAAENAELLRRGNVVVLLDADADEIYQRLRAEVGQRPMLHSDDALARIRGLKAEREAPYRRAAHHVVSTAGISPEEAARRVRDLLPPGLLANLDPSVRIGFGLLDQVPAMARQRGLHGRAFLVADEGAWKALRPQVEPALGDWVADVLTIPAGEESKSLEALRGIYDWLIERRAERRDLVVALGGGVVGDLAGYAAATYLRGVPLVQLPTTLLGQLDSSIGGKTAVNHPRGKNLIGAFYSAHLTVIDPALLATLPRRELTAGWGEAVKYGMSLDAHLFAFMERHATALCDPTSWQACHVIRTGVQWKLRIVAEDPQETGIRAILNYGHTLGHAIETVTGYGRYLHGEAVALGMVGVASIAERLGRLNAADVERQNRLIAAMGLPTRCPDVDPQAIIQATLYDKKARGGRVRWVLANGVGQASIGVDVPNEVVEAAVEELTAVG